MAEKYYAGILDFIYRFRKEWVNSVPKGLALLPDLSLFIIHCHNIPFVYFKNIIYCINIIIMLYF